MGDDIPPKKSGPQRLQAALDAFGLDLEVAEFPASTRTAEDAAAAIGCTPAQIAKSIILRAEGDDRPVLVVASGVNRVDENKVAGLIGQSIGRADADFVRARTGFAIGGVPPAGHREAPIALLDRDLLAHAAIWAAAGAPNAVFRLTPTQLARITGAPFEDVRRDG